MTRASGARLKAPQPSFLAIDGGVLAADLESFDIALLGNRVEHHGLDQTVAGFSFDAKGEMPIDSSSPWAGVLAFLSPGVFGATDPVLCLSPHYRGNDPFAFLRLRRRMLATQDYPARGDPLTARIRFAERLTEGPD